MLSIEMFLWKWTVHIIFEMVLFGAIDALMCCRNAVLRCFMSQPAIINNHRRLLSLEKRMKTDYITNNRRKTEKEEKKALSHFCLYAVFVWRCRLFFIQTVIYFKGSMKWSSSVAVCFFYSVVVVNFPFTYLSVGLNSILAFCPLSCRKNETAAKTKNYAI